jgi:hypothetical protein
MAREMRIRYRDLTLAVAVALALDVVAVALVYAVDLSPLGPLKRLYGPWGLPCLSAAACPAPCPEKPGGLQSSTTAEEGPVAPTPQAGVRARPTEVSFLDGPLSHRCAAARTRRQPACADDARAGPTER